MVGFKSANVFYERHERLAGESHYPLGKMLALAFNGITSLSVKPIRLILSCGVIITSLSVLIAFCVFIKQLFSGAFTSLTYIFCLIGLFSGLQLIGLGIIGEYIGKIYMETKARPRYIISERTTNLKNN